jgi:hypothetical protein
MDKQNPQAEQNVIDGTAWREFCDELKSLADIITREDTPNDAFNRAEGFRYLTRLLRNSLNATMEYSDEEFPDLQSLGHMVKLGADNPDNIYQGCRLNPNYDYKIIGNRNSVFYLSFSSISGSYGSNAKMIVDGFIDNGELAVNDDGSFEIIVSVNQHEGNWLPLTSDTKSINIRQTFLDRSHEKAADLTIARIGTNDKPAPFTAKQMHDGLKQVSQYMHGTVNLFADWSASFKPDINTLPPADQAYCQSIGGDPNIFYFHSYWELADDEALVIEAKTIPECSTWNFQLDNYWMESLDYRHHQITLNKHTAAYNDDGSVRLVVAHQDPGEPNWIDTAGHLLGTMCWRWIGATEYPPVNTRVVKLSDLAA